jgi:hypothetical protein
MLPSRLYTSDAMNFLRDFKRQHPETTEKQREALKVWWDHDPETVKARRAIAEETRRLHVEKE